VNQAAHSKASKLLADRSHYKEKGHRCGRDDQTQSSRNSRVKQLSLKAHFYYQVKIPLSLMVIDAI